MPYLLGHTALSIIVLAHPALITHIYIALISHTWAHSSYHIYWTHCPHHIYWDILLSSHILRHIDTFSYTLRHLALITSTWSHFSVTYGNNLVSFILGHFALIARQKYGGTLFLSHSLWRIVRITHTGAHFLLT